MKRNLFIIIISVILMFSSCYDKKIASITYNNNTYEIFYSYGNATNAEYLIIEKNGVAVVKYKNASDSIEKIVIGGKKNFLVMDWYDKDLRIINMRDTIYF